MHKHHGRHNDASHHAHILMYGSRESHAGGGAAAGNMVSNTSSYKGGGHPHRKRHAEGDMAGKSPITGTRSPDIIARSRGGRTCHAEGDTVAVPYRRGGKPHRHRHAEGEMAELSKHDESKADGGAAALRRGGGAHHHRHRHAKGEMAELMARGGHKKKTVGREHHSFGQTAGNIVGKILPFLPMLLKEGGSTDMEPMRLAAGGVGKLRKGMITKSGKILNAPVHSPMHMPFRSRSKEYRPG